MDAALTPIEIGLTAAIVAVEGDEPMILIAGESGRCQAAAGTAVRPVRSGRAPHLRDRLARLGRSADRAFGRLCRAALHLRRPRPACAGRRHRSACGLDRLSGADAAAGERRRAASLRRPVRAMVPFLSLGGLARCAARRSSTARSCRCCSTGRRSLDRPVRRLALGRHERLRLCFGVGGRSWDEEKVLDRYELLYEAGLGRGGAARRPRRRAGSRKALPALGVSMRFDHRRILATAIARLRAKLKYRPGDLRTDAGRFHADRIAAHGRGDFRPASAQAEFPPPGGDDGAGRADR